MRWTGGRARPRGAALLREIPEETTATLRKLVLGLERGDGPTTARRERFYLADVESWGEMARSGPELLAPDAGESLLDEVPLTADEIASRHIKPGEMKRWLLDPHATLDALPALRR